MAITDNKNITDPVTTEPVLKDTSKPGSYDKFMEASRKSMADYDLSDAEQVAVQARTDNQMMLDDAVNNVAKEHSISRILMGDDPGTLPEQRTLLDIDVESMYKDINDGGKKLSYDDRIKYQRTLQVIDGIQKGGFAVTKSPGGKYWIESRENGKRYYAANHLREVSELLDLYSSEAEVPEDGEDSTKTTTKTTTKDKELPYLEDIAKSEDLDFGLTSGDKWWLASLATDLASTGAGIGMKATGVGYIPSMVVSGVGGLASMGLAAYGDYLNDVPLSDILKSAGMRLGAEAVEATTGLPSIISSAPKLAKILKKASGALLLYGSADTLALATEWEELASKDSWDMQDYRRMANALQILMSGGAGMVGARRASKDLQKGYKSTKATDAEVKTDLTGKDPAAAAINYPQHYDKTLTKPQKKNIKEVSKETAKVVEPKVKKIEADRKKALETVEQARQSVGKINPLDKRGSGRPSKERLAQEAELSTKKAEHRKLDKEESLINRKADQEIKSTTRKELDNQESKLLARRKSNFDKEFQNIQNEVDTQFGGSMWGSRGLGQTVKNRAMKKAMSPEDYKAFRDSQKPGKKVYGSQKKVAEAEAEIKSIKDDIAKNKEITSYKGKEKKTRPAGPTQDQKDKLKAAQEKLAEVKKTSESFFNKSARGVRGVGSTIGSVGRGASNLANTGFDIITMPGANYGGGKTHTLTKTFATSDQFDRWAGGHHSEMSRGELLDVLNRMGYTIKEMEQFSTKDLRAALENLKGAAVVGKGATEKMENGGKMKLISRKGGVRKAQVGGYFGVSPWDLIKNKVSEWFDPSYVDNSDYVPRPAPEDDPVVKDTGKPQRSSGKQTIAGDDVVPVTGDPKPVEKAINWDMTDMLTNFFMNKYGKGDGSTPPPTQAEVEEDYKEMVSTLPPTVQKPSFTDFLAIANRAFKPSDFMGRNRLHSTTPHIRRPYSPTIYAAPVTNMPGYSRMMGELNKRSKADTADYFVKNMHGRQQDNDTLAKKQELIAMNAQYVDRARQNQLNARNQTNQLKSAEDNRHTAYLNQLNTQIAAQDSAQRAQHQANQNKLWGRRANAAGRFLQEVNDQGKAQQAFGKYKELAKLQDIWSKEYEPRLSKAIESDNLTEATKLKTDFNKTYGYNPEDIRTDLLESMMEYKRYGGSSQ